MVTAMAKAVAGGKTLENGTTIPKTIGETVKEGKNLGTTKLVANGGAEAEAGDVGGEVAVTTRTTLLQIL